MLADGWRLRGFLGDDRQLHRAQLHARDEGDDTTRWVPARVPGTVLADLLAAGQVPDPYVGTRSLLSEWAPQRTWVYHRRLRVPPLDVDGAARVHRGVHAAGSGRPGRRDGHRARRGYHRHARARGPRPLRWHLNGAGPAHRYVLDTAVRDGTGMHSDTRRDRIGFRDVRFTGDPGTLPYRLTVDGRPTVIKGWNWVPADALYGTVDPARLRHLLTLARDAGVTVLRVWGGGLVESEAFYDLCDELGILVWQGFAQSSSGMSSTPSTDPAFVARMAAEAEPIVRGRRNHPSLAVWCGGNELQRPDGVPLTDADSPVPAALHDVVARPDPDRLWLPTSPSGPVFANTLASTRTGPAQHDVHGPWEHQGLADHYRLYDEGRALLLSEFGVEGMSNLRRSSPSCQGRGAGCRRTATRCRTTSAGGGTPSRWSGRRSGTASTTSRRCPARASSRRPTACATRWRPTAAVRRAAGCCRGSSTSRSPTGGAPRRSTTSASPRRSTTTCAGPAGRRTCARRCPRPAWRVGSWTRRCGPGPTAAPARRRSPPASCSSTAARWRGRGGTSNPVRPGSWAPCVVRRRTRCSCWTCPCAWAVRTATTGTCSPVPPTSAGCWTCRRRG